MIPHNPLLVALGGRSAEDAVRLAGRLAPHVGGFVVGTELLMGPGPGVVGAIARIGPVAVDAKLHELPEIAARAALRLGEYGARWVTVHASGGAVMLAAAVEGMETGSGGNGGILATSVLTSLDAAALAETGLGNRPGKLVARLAKIAAGAGAEGVVCSPKELGDVVQVAPGLVRVAAGIRGEGAGIDDHRRVASAEEARRRGADLLIVGRPIIASPDPVEAAASLAGRLAR
jgi:orotidine-5'-phosphate decarboxylase